MMKRRIRPSLGSPAAVAWMASAAVSARRIRGPSEIERRTGREPQRRRAAHTVSDAATRLAVAHRPASRLIAGVERDDEVELEEGEVRQRLDVDAGHDVDPVDRQTFDLLLHRAQMRRDARASKDFDERDWTVHAGGKATVE